MNNPFPGVPSENDRRFELLVNRLIEGIASDIEIEQLETLLAGSDGLVNREFVDRYLELMSIDSLLHWRLGHVAEPVSLLAAKTDSTSASRRSIGRLWVSRPAFAIGIVAATIALVALIGLNSRRAGHQKSRSEVADQVHNAPVNAPSGHQSLVTTDLSAAVARVTRMVECRWIVSDAAPQQGDLLRAGQSLRLAEGVVSLDFDIGAKLILQGPAELSILSAKELRLDRGKLAAEITTTAAHGFTVYTPQGKLVDLGTEFGVEIAPEGSSKVHVFRGKVEVSLPSVDGKPPLATECLLANGSVRVDAGTETMNLVGDTGESYVRSLDRFKKEQHVVAYWRFEDRPLGAVAPHTNRNINPIRATVDSSFNGNDLYAWSDESRPKFSGDVSQDIVAQGTEPQGTEPQGTESQGTEPQTTSPNHTCLDNTSLVPSYGGNATSRNVYTHSAFSHAAPLDIQKIAPAQWTIEASVKPVAMGSGSQTIVGRDTIFPPSWKNSAPPRLALEITKERRFAISFYDVSSRFHRAVAETLPVQANRWYHVAAASDGRFLKLYVCECVDNRGYQLCGEVQLPTTGSTALGKGSDEAEWTIGRGLDEGHPSASSQFQGLIDEVRISDIARKPEELLFSPATGIRARRGPAP